MLIKLHDRGIGVPMDTAPPSNSCMGAFDGVVCNIGTPTVSV